MTIDNIISFPKPTPKPDPWAKAQPSLTTHGDRDELWSHPYFGISHLIWATGSPNVPEPPSPPTGGTPAAANVGSYTRLRVAA